MTIQQIIAREYEVLNRRYETANNHLLKAVNEKKLSSSLDKVSKCVQLEIAKKEYPFNVLVFESQAFLSMEEEVLIQRVKAEINTLIKNMSEKSGDEKIGFFIAADTLNGALPRDGRLTISVDINELKAA